jgi:hypothetical protein
LMSNRYWKKKGWFIWCWAYNKSKIYFIPLTRLWNGTTSSD